MPKSSGFTTTSLHSCGFTLVELLVVISIIGILSTIGMVVFTRVSQTARDGKRVADIDAIVKSLETSKDFTTGIYYNKLSTDFPDSNGGIPTDPTSTRSYCICTTTDPNTTIVDFPFAWWSYICPTSSYCSNGCPSAACPNGWSWGPWVKVTNTSFSATKFWSICTVKEAVNQVYCKHSLGR